MREKIKQKIALAVKPHKNFSMKIINSYSFGRKARGGWELLLFFSVRQEAKHAKHVKLPIGISKKFRDEVEETLEAIILENTATTMLDDTEPTNTNKEGW